VEETLSKDDSTEKLKRIEKEISSLEKKRKKLTDMYLDDKISKEAYDDKYSELGNKLDKCEEEKEYTASKIVITKAMGTSDVMDWNLESITKRDIRVSDEVVKIMNRWNNEYLNTPVSEGKGANLLRMIQLSGISE